MATSAISWFGLELSHSEKSCLSQKKHVPHEIVNGTTTRSPFFSFFTALPVSTTMPIGSCPTTSPSFRVGMNALYRCRSDPHIAVLVIWMMMSVGSMIVGSGTVSTRMSRLPCQAIAFISPPVLLYYVDGDARRRCGDPLLRIFCGC